MTTGSNCFFWSDVEKEHVMQYNEMSEGYGKTVIDNLLYPLMKVIADQVPGRVAPNVLTLAGLITLLHAAYLSHKHSEAFPVATSVACAGLVTAYYVLDAIDGLHAVRIRNKSNIGSLLVASVNSAAPVLLMIVLCRTVLGISDLATVWYAVQAMQLFFLFIHCRELHGTSRHLVRWFIPGPAALVPLFPLLCLCRAGLEFLSDEWVRNCLGLWWQWVDFVVGYVEQLPGCATVGQTALEAAQRGTWHQGFLTLYVMSLVSVATACLISPKHKQGTSKEALDNCRHTQTRLLLCLGYRVFPALMLNFVSEPGVSMTTIIVDGLFCAVLMTDMVVAKMAKRAMHPWVVLFCMASVFDLFVETLLCFLYYGSVFYDLAEHSKLPLFTVQRNVYVDGVYDLCHIGHMRMFAASAKFGNALFVGVVNDEDATPYKRKPIMTHEERCTEVAACKFVTKVIPNAPCFGLSRDFIEQHNIHVVVCGEEYFNKPDDKYYKVPREMGILQAAPRTQGMSTSDLIQRILRAEQGSLAPKDKMRGESTVPM